MEWVETTGRTIEEAKDDALDRLGIPEDDAEFLVVSDVKVGLFGRVKEEARVRARVRPATPRAKNDRRRGRSRSRRGGGNGSRRSGRDARRGDTRKEKAASDTRASNGDETTSVSGGRESTSRRSKKSGRSGPKGGSSTRPQNERGGRPDKEQGMQEDTGLSLEDQAGLAESFVQGLAERFGTSLAFSRQPMEDDILRIEAVGDDIGPLVGHRGATAQAVDELVRTVLQRAGGTTREGKIRVDIGGVRAKRAAALATFVTSAAAQAVESGTEIVLEPMGGADRKVVHDVVNDIDGVETRSEGEDPHRRVVLVPSAASD